MYAKEMMMVEAAAGKALAAYRAARGVGLRLYWARAGSHVTQVELAQALGISRTTVARIESGARRMTGSEAAIAARVLGVSLDYLRATDAPGQVRHTSSAFVGNGKVAA